MSEAEPNSTPQFGTTKTYAAEVIPKEIQPDSAGQKKGISPSPEENSCRDVGRNGDTRDSRLRLCQITLSGVA